MGEVQGHAKAKAMLSTPTFLPFNSSFPRMYHNILSACHSWVATINSPKNGATSKATAALLPSAQGCQHALPQATFQPCPSGAQGRAESHTQPQVLMYTGTTPSRGDPQDHLFSPVMPTLSTDRYFCLPQPQLLHHDVKCASSAPSGCKLKLMGQNNTAVYNAPA